MTYRITQIAFLLLIFSLPFVQPFNLHISGLMVQVSEILFLLTGVLFFICVALKKIELKFSKFYLLLAFYLTAFVVSTYFSHSPQQSLYKLLGQIYLIGLCVLTFNLIRSTEFLKSVFIVWLIATFFVSTIGALTVLFFYIFPNNDFFGFSLHHYGTLIPGNYPRLQATFFYPAMLCNYLSISLMIAITCYYLSWIGNKIFFPLFFLILVTLLFTITPGLGGVALSLGLWFWLVLKLRQQKNSSLFSLFGGIFLALAFFGASLFSPIQTPTSPYFFTVPLIEMRVDPSVRLLAWQTSAKTFFEYPLFGSGPGTPVASVLYKDASGRFQFLTDAHQIWLNVAAQTGILGLLAILFITFYFLKISFTLLISKEKIIQTGLNLAFISAFFYQGFVGSFEDARHLWILTGLLLSLQSFENKDF